ncbi:MAG: type II toxin-antitoxin system RelE/ParE family toxin [Sphingobacteriia bacterium]|nr:type II toxin-antitoxin system RelE/ParE family toxin [Sphingobacteriia bacterium]
MNWKIEYLDEFEEWWDSLKEDEKISVDAGIYLLEERGPLLNRPHSDTIKGSKHSNLKELRVQHKGRPLRVLYAFDPRRVAILILGGDKTGDDSWYDKMIKKADNLFDEHLKSIKEK